MAFQHLYFSPTTEYGAKLRSALSLLESGMDNIVRVRDTMTFMIDGDGSLASQFNEVVSRFGFPDTATAKAAWDELNSYIAKVTTDASVTNCNTALKQMINKLR